MPHTHPMGNELEYTIAGDKLKGEHRCLLAQACGTGTGAGTAAVMLLAPAALPFTCLEELPAGPCCRRPGAYGYV